MTLEERVEALETALANQHNDMKKAVSSAIQNAMRPGGCLYTAVKATQNQAASINDGENRGSPRFSGVISALQQQKI